MDEIKEEPIKLDWKYFIIYILIALLISMFLVQCKNKRDLPQNLAGESVKNEVVNVTDRNYSEEDTDNADTRDVPGTIGESVYTTTSETSADVSGTTTTTSHKNSTTTDPSSNKNTTTTKPDSSTDTTSPTEDNSNVSNPTEGDGNIEDGNVTSSTNYTPLV